MATQTGWHQRSKMANEWEEIALEAYSEHDLPVLWMPFFCPFDFVINGHRVDVKGSTESSRGVNAPRFIFATFPHKDHHDCCTIYHLIGREDCGLLHHYFVPAEAVGSRRQIAIPCRPLRDNLWERYEGQWGLIGKGDPPGVTKPTHRFVPFDWTKPHQPVAS